MPYATAVDVSDAWAVLRRRLCLCVIFCPIDVSGIDGLFERRSAAAMASLACFTVRHFCSLSTEHVDTGINAWFLEVIFIAFMLENRRPNPARAFYGKQQLETDAMKSVDPLIRELDRVGASTFAKEVS